MEEFFGLPEKRNKWQWNKVKYAYMDARRQANKRENIKIYGPKKAFDSTLSLAGCLYLQKYHPNGFLEYHNNVFKKFFERELDIEDQTSMKNEIEKSGGNFEEFLNYLPTAKLEMKKIEEQACELGVFGVPTLVDNDNELFFGNERVEYLKEKLLLKKPKL
eukprot:TRINITY_DN4211_c0_g2_i1.p1 TRINITY_DN4211_c0_g2~~TRINITY_DN4211_c0_g2_i1.p1  ORF type:complete len:161 (-),score=56.34 TRINITY_DN4211_c0_g2_i1:110-592(-)